MPTLFTKIINGEIPSYKIYENEYIFAFLDIYSTIAGHTLIAPKVEVDYWVDVPEPFYTEVFQSAKKIAPAIQKATNSIRIITKIVGTDVPHFHYHLIPMRENKNTEKLTNEELSSIQAAILQFL